MLISQTVFQKSNGEVRSSLTEMPIEKLLNVKQALTEEKPEPNESQTESTADVKTQDETATGAMPLKGDWFDHLYPKKQRKTSKVPVRRGDWDDEKGHDKGDVSKVFQTTITVLSFLAFGGYLLCMICMAIRNNQGLYQNTTTTTTTTGRRKRDTFLLDDSIFLDVTTEGLHRLAEGYAMYHLSKMNVVIGVCLLVLLPPCHEAIGSPAIPESLTESPKQLDEDSTPQADALFFNPLSNGGGFLEKAARTVAQLVSSSFAPPRRTAPKETPQNDLFGSLLKLMGLNSSKLNAIAVNAVIFIAQMLGTSLSVPHPDDRNREDIPPPGSPLGWIFDQSPLEARALVNAAEDHTLPDQLIGMIRHGTTEETDCIQLLICNMAPIVWSMQRYLYKPPDPVWPSMTPMQRMFLYLPTFRQIIHNSEGCDVKFPQCKVRYSKRR
ncbi:Hypothetical protein NTJ_13887 [Nesidiocoris tenuis]|uniref:Uncharacterized protein n=1 Tax=Nesidiocoris tenuis TaxID=355587 RepID=A0ABN7BCZ6_9HEMI|nr:Hypothetical protein NTJ_13887 [Nesidiocoris tenuis]